jgi:hypothetical protein
MEAPQVERLWGRDGGCASEIAGDPFGELPLAEIEDLGSRRLTDQQIAKSTPRVD